MNIVMDDLRGEGRGRGRTPVSGPATSISEQRARIGDGDAHRFQAGDEPTSIGDQPRIGDGDAHPCQAGDEPTSIGDQRGCREVSLPPARASLGSGTQPVLQEADFLLQPHRRSARVVRMMGRIKVLRSLCKVLDSNSEDKLEELGQWEELEEGTAEWKTAENRLERTIQTLLETREERYNKLKECGTKVIQQWKSNDTPPSRIVDFSEALAFYDSASATESSAQLTGYRALNIDSIKKINNEILLQKSLELKELKAKFVRRKKKLLSLIQKSHFPSSLVHFDFEMKVETNKDYFAACEELKEAISSAKAQVVKRKEIIMRTEMLKLAVDQAMPLANINGFIQVIKTQVDVLVQDEGRHFIYDGEDIHLTLNKLKTIASNKKAPQTSGSKLRNKKIVLEKGMQEKASGTSGASFSLPAANAGKESLVVARKKPTAVSRSSSRLKEKQAQLELRRMTRLSAKVLTQQESSSSQIGEEEDYSGETSRASSSLFAANARQESRFVARKKPAACLRASSRLKEKQTQPELRRTARVSVKVFPQQVSSGSRTGEECSGQSSLPVGPQLIASLPPHPRQPRTLRVEIRPGEAMKDDNS